MNKGKIQQLPDYKITPDLTTRTHRLTGPGVDESQAMEGQHIGVLEFRRIAEMCQAAYNAGKQANDPTAARDMVERFLVNEFSFGDERGYPDVGEVVDLVRTWKPDYKW